MKEITFKARSRFRQWEIKRLWVLYGVPLKTVQDMTESLMHSLNVPPNFIPSLPYEEETEWTAFI